MIINEKKLCFMEKVEKNMKNKLTLYKIWKSENK